MTQTYGELAMQPGRVRRLQVSQGSRRGRSAGGLRTIVVLQLAEQGFRRRADFRPPCNTPSSERCVAAQLPRSHCSGPVTARDGATTAHGPSVGLESASKIGSTTSFKDAWTTRSVTVAIPKRRSFPPAFGIMRSRTGSGRKLRSFNCDRSPPRKSSTPCPASTERAVRPSTPAVRDPLLPLTRSQATRRKPGSATRL